MNIDQTQRNWKQFVGRAKQKWDRLTDDDWHMVEEEHDQLAHKLQERYGITRPEAERQIADFLGLSG